MTWEQACKAVVNAAKRSQGANIKFAAAYADVGRGMTSEVSRRTQALYILSNLSGWRGEEAKEVREFFKGVAK